MSNKNPSQSNNGSPSIIRFDRAFIGGQWVRVPGDQTEVFFDSYSETLLGEVVLAGGDLVDAAVTAANAALPIWSATPVEERAAYVRRIGEILRGKQDELAASVSREVGMPIKLSSRIQVAGPADAWKQYADAALQFEFRSKIRHSSVELVPVGVVACITPWNYPLHQITAKVAPAMLAGCTVVLKPSELAPSSAIALAEAVEEAGVPAGVFNMLFGNGPGAGSALIAHKNVQMVSFTGSTAVGKIIAGQAAPMMKRLALELGGKSASIVLPGADLSKAVKSTISSCMLNSGQTCNALTRLLVPTESIEEVKQAVRVMIDAINMGDPFDASTRMGPLVSRAHAGRVRAMIEAAVDDGAEIVAGGLDVRMPETGYFVPPTVLCAQPTTAIAQEEVFGPVLCILTYGDIDEAVSIANGTPYGLAAAVWAPDVDKGVQVARRLRAGQIDVNGASFNIAAPFGGFGMSGVGRENGPIGLAEFLEPISIQTPS